MRRQNGSSPPAGKARIYATTSLFKVCTYIVRCVNTSHPIPASVRVNLQYVGDLTNLDNFVFVDVDPGDVDLYFAVRGTTHNPVAGVRARLRAEEGGVYFYRVSGGSQPRPMSDAGTMLWIGTHIEQFAVEQLPDTGRQLITERRLVLPSEHPRFPETRLAGGSQPSTSSSNPVSGSPVGVVGGIQPSPSSSDPVGDAAETAGRVAGVLLEAAFYFALGAASAPPRGSSGRTWDNPSYGLNNELTMHCTPARQGPVLGTQECGCNSNNQYFKSIFVQGAACPIFIRYNITNNTWRN